jgi:hypothetical protein
MGISSFLFGTVWGEDCTFIVNILALLFIDATHIIDPRMYWCNLDVGAKNVV